jgi:hypothetical protein
MLTFLPFFLLILIVILVEIISRSKLNIGNQWLVLVLSTLLVWGVMLFLRSHLPQPVTIRNWLLAGNGVGEITFQLDAGSWTFAFALISMLAGMILVDTIRLHERTNIRDWSMIVLQFSLGVAGALMNSLLAFILVWTLIDVIELIAQLSGDKQGRSNSQFIGIFFAHLIGTFLILKVLVLNPSIGSAINSAPLSMGDTALLVIGAGMRMFFFSDHSSAEGTFALHTYRDDLRKVLSPFLAMVLLTRMPEVAQISGALAWLFVVCVFVVLYASIRWFKAADPIKADSFWMTAFSGLAIISVLRGMASSVAAWGILMLILIGWLKLYSYRVRWMHAFAFIILIGLMGVPSSMASPAITSLTMRPLAAFNIFLWISLAFLAAGFLRAALKHIEMTSEPEEWMKLFYVLGLALVTVVPWIPGFWKSAHPPAAQVYWIAPVLVVITALIVIFTLVQKARTMLISAIPAEVHSGFSRVELAAEKAADTGWIVKLFDSFYGLLRRLISGVNRILEGEGGILWAFVFLVLLISLLASNVGK